MTLLWPTTSTVVAVGGTYLFDRGPKHIPRFHQGVDIHISTGTPIYASGAGVVTALPNTGNVFGFGRYAQVQYGDVQVRTAHMSSFANNLRVGSAVTANTLLGLSGGAHLADGAGDSTGSHCHLEVHVAGRLADPAVWLMDRTAAADSGSAVPVQLLPLEGDLMATFYVRYTSANPNVWVAVDDVEKTFRILPAGAFESNRLDNRVAKGQMIQDNIADPEWGATFGNGQFTRIPS